MSIRDLAPGAFTAWAELVGAVLATTPAELVDTARAVAGGALGTSTGPVARTAAVTFGEQIVIDVASLSDEVRAAGLTELGRSAAGFVLAVWIEDMKARADRALLELLGAYGLGLAVSSKADNPWAAQDRFLLEVAKLDALDPVTTELVRLRGARAHACRLCQSRRDVTAIDMTGRTDLFEAAEPSGLSRAQELALQVVDAFVWQPLHWPLELGAETAAALGPQASVELVLDLVRNAANKIAVAFAADAPQVESGVEYFAIDPVSGALRYDVSPGALG